MTSMFEADFPMQGVPLIGATPKGEDYISMSWL